MRFLAVSIAAVLVLLAARPVLPACGDRPGDAGAVAATRAAAEARCDCAAATSHDGYVQCVGRVASDAVRNGQLRLRCRRAVVSCARRSTCGRPGAVTCCGGAGQCAITSAAACTAPGGSACAGDQPSCCDACAGGCAPVKTTTTTYVLPVEKADPHKDRDYPWFGETFTLGDKQYSVVYLNHPSNPKDAKISAYRDYGRFGAYFRDTIPAGDPSASARSKKTIDRSGWWNATLRPADARKRR